MKGEGGREGGDSHTAKQHTHTSNGYTGDANCTGVHRMGRLLESIVGGVIASHLPPLS